MFGLPADFDAQMFIGRTLSSVTFAENLINLHFDEELTVTVLGSISYRTAAEGEETVDTPPLATTTLPGLVGRVVVSCQVRSPRELVVGFDGGGSVRFVDDSDMYESFTIRGADTEIVV